MRSVDVKGDEADDDDEIQPRARRCKGRQETSMKGEKNKEREKEKGVRLRKEEHLSG